MLLFLVLLGFAGMLIFHSFPVVVYLLLWQVIVCTFFYICERMER